MRHLITLAAAALALAACSGGTREPPSAIDKMPRADVEAIVKDYLIKNPEVIIESLNEFQKREAQKTFVSLVSNKDDPSLGPKDAPITIVEFFDYNCGYCKAANEWLFDKLDAKPGDVRVVFKEYPVLSESSHAAATAALAAGKQGKYREMHVALMKTRDLSSEGIDKVAKSVGLNIDKFHADMKSKDVADSITRVLNEGAEAGVHGTPGFFINGEALNGFDENSLNRILKEAREKVKG